MKEIKDREALLETVCASITDIAAQEVYELFLLFIATLTPRERDPPGKLSVKDAVLYFIFRMVTALSFKEIEKKTAVPHSTGALIWKWVIGKVLLSFGRKFN